MPTARDEPLKHDAQAAPAPRAPSGGTPRQPPAAQDPLATELVARTDELLVLLEAASVAEKRLRDAARSLFRGVTRESAAQLANAISVDRAAPDATEAAERVHAAARAWLAAHGALEDTSPDHLKKDPRPHASPPGTIVSVLAPAWKTQRGDVILMGEAVVSAGPGSSLARALERADRGARKLARRAEDVAERFVDLRAELEKLDRRGEIKRAIEAFRYVESLAVIHTAAGIDVAESALADLAVFLEERGVRREPRERLEGAPDEPGSTESDLARIRWIEDPSPLGTVVRRLKSAFVEKGALVDGEQGEVLASLGQRSDAERRLLDLARSQEPGSPLARALVRFRKLAGKDNEGAARVLVELLAELRAAGRTRRLDPEVPAGVERLLAQLGAERFEPSSPGPGVEVAAREPDARPEGSITRTLEAGWKLRGAVLVAAKVAISTGPRSALPPLLDAALARPLAEPVKSLVAAARARAAALTLEAAEGETGLACALDLARAVPSDDSVAALRRDLDAYLAARGLTAFPQDVGQARADLERSNEGYEVEHVRSERPRGEIVSIVARGWRSPEGVERKARVARSRGPGDPLARALVALAEALGATPVPELSPLARLAGIAQALEAPSTGSSTRIARDPIAEAAAAARAAELLAASQPPIAGRVLEVLERALAPALAACGVEPVPTFGAEALAPSQAELADADLEDSPKPAGALLAVKKRGWVRAGQTLARAQVSISRGPRPALLEVAAKIAAAKGPLADLAAELVRRADAARGELALGRASEARARDPLVDSGLALLRAAERAGVDTTDLRAALTVVHDHVEVFPAGLEGLDAEELANDPAFEVETVYDEVAPKGSVLRLVRAGVRDRRAGLAKLERARVLASLGRRPAIEHALDALAAEQKKDPLAPAGVEDRVRAVREAARGLLGRAPGTLEGRLREALAQATAALLDLVEARGSLEPLLAALKALGVRAFPEPGEKIERTSQRIEATREHSDTVPSGELLRLVRRGLETEGKLVRAAKVVVSLGRKEELEVLADELEALVPRLPAAAQEPLARALMAERTTAAGVREGKTLPPVGARSGLVLDAVNASLALLAPGERGRLLALRPALSRALATAGLELFPAGDALEGTLLADSAAVEIEAAEFAGGERGALLAVSRLGCRKRDSVRTTARVSVDLGPRPPWLADLEAAEKSGAAAGPLLARVRDPRRGASDEELALALFELHAATAGAREPLERALRALGAEVFPRAGEAPASGIEQVPVYAEEPAGTIVRVSASGLRRGTHVLRAAKAEVSRGPMSQALKTLASLASTPALEALRARLEALPVDKQSGEEGERILVEALASGPAPEVVAYLRERGYVVAPDAPGGTIDSLKATLGGEQAIEAPRRRFSNAPAGEILSVERPAVAKGELVLAKARLVVSAGAASEVHVLIQEVRDKLAQETSDAKTIAELDDVLEKAADAKPDRVHFLAFPVMNVLHRLGAKDRLGGGIKGFLRARNIREITAYAGYPAAELGPKKLEEVRVSSEREKGKIVKVLRPGFEEEKSGAVLQKVQAEVSR